MIGSVLQDRYAVEKQIGEGGFATVYRGHDNKLKRPVAIKVLTDVNKNSTTATRFLREAESMAKFNHPNIATVYDYAEHNGRPYLVMEYITGPTLLELAEKAELTPAQVCTIARQICQAMAYAHKLGVIHRDLTLRNVMIEERDGSSLAKILDFGLAKMLHADTQSTGRSLLGTPYYMAPEQIRNDTIDARTDIFAFGVGLYRLTNGRFPFEAEHPTALLYMNLHESVSEFADGLPSAMQELITRCLEKDPRSRPRDFDELIPDIEAIEKEWSSAGDSISAMGLDAFANRSSKRNPYLNRVMIKNPSEFFGRAKEIRKIYSRFDAPQPQSISIVGERRVGKSSLLNYVYHPRNRKKYMQTNEQAILVYLDFQSEADHDVPKFIDFLFNMFSYETKGHDYRDREKSLDELKKVVQELHNEGKRIIILMDEFEVITRNPNFDEAFFSFLRSLANTYKVSYVTSSYEDLQKMCHNKLISDSPFFNIFSSLRLRPFAPDEAMELISVPSEAEGVPLRPHASEILDLAGLSPLFLQIACSSTFEYLVDNPDAEPDWRQITQTFMDEVDQHYRFVWERMDKPSRENLSKIAAGKSISGKYKFVNEELVRRGYLVETDDGIVVCSSSFESFVGRQKESGRGGKGFFGSLLKRRT